MKIQFDTNWNEKQKKALWILLNQNNWVKSLWYWWGAWWWKSYLWVFWVWLMCFQYPWISTFFWRKELKNLKRTTLASYFKMLADYEIPEQYHWNFNSQDWVINFSNWSKIYLLDLSHQPSDPLYLRFGSLELTLWFIDESNEVNYSWIDILKTRVWRQRNKEYWIIPRILETFNPDKWHVYRRYYKPFKNNEEKDDTKFITSLATDNKYLDESYIESLRNAEPVTRERLLYWNFEYDDSPWRIFDFEAIQDMFTNNIDWWTKYITADIARKGKDLAVIYVWDWLKIVDKVVYKTCTLTELQDKIKQLCRIHAIWMRNVIVDEDWVWGWVVDSLKCKGFINNSKQIEFRWNKLNYQNLKTQCYFKLSEYVNLNKIAINDSIFNWDEKEKLIEELDIVVEIDLDKDWKKRIIQKDLIKEKLWRSPDYADALMFRMFFEIKPKAIIFG